MAINRDRSLNSWNDFSREYLRDEGWSNQWEGSRSLWNTGEDRNWPRQLRDGAMGREADFREHSLSQPLDSDREEIDKEKHDTIPHYVGYGPKGYQRSDRLIEEDIHHCLNHQDLVDAQDVRVTVHDGEVVLEGFVQRGAEKRQIEDIVELVRGVRDLQNRIRIAQIYPQAN